MSLIYHYCDAEAFLSMIRYDTMWLSSLYYMNDTGEIEYFRELAIPAVVKAIHECNSHPNAALFFDSAVRNPQYYGACFSSESDDLYQWQAYGQKGRGFAVGFDPDALCPTKPPAMHVDGIGEVAGPFAGIGEQTIGISSVRYADVDEIKGFVEILVAEARQEGHTGANSVATLAAAVNILSVTIKNRMFSAENEKRLLYSPLINYPLDGSAETVLTDIKPRLWRNGVHGFTPYFEKPNIKQAIRKIVLGPACKETNGRRFNDFLFSVGLSAIGVEVSKATLR